MINEIKLTELDINYVILLVAFRTNSSSPRVSLLPDFYVIANGEKSYGTVRFEQYFTATSQKINIKINDIFDSAVNVDNIIGIDLISFYRDMMR